MSEPRPPIAITPTSRSSATVTDVVLRETDQVRLVFRPQIVDNPHNRRACVDGSFIYQRKRKKDDWEDVNNISLSKVHSGEAYKLELHAEEVLNFLFTVGKLWKRYAREEVPSSPTTLVEVETRLAPLLSLNEPDLRALVEAHQDDTLTTVARVARLISGSSSFRTLLSANPERLPMLTASLGLASLKEAFSFWEVNSASSDEPLWQRGLSERAFLFSQLFHYPVVVVLEKAYVGGKRVSNTRGGVVDYLVQAEMTKSAVLIEIKTPSTPLLGGVYRGEDVYPPSRDLGGGIAQLLQYKATLQREVRDLRADYRDDLEADDPHCVLIIGNSAELDSPAKKQAFDRFRARLHGAAVVTFDELFARVKNLIDLLSGIGD